LTDIGFKRVRDRPFNLKGGGGYGILFRSEFFFSDNTRVRIFFLSREAQINFLEFNIRLYDKNSESGYFFFPPPNSECFFQQHWESEYFFWKKNHNPPLQVKWSFPYTWSKQIFWYKWSFPRLKNTVLHDLGYRMSI
jgi:hypothetical protein